MSRPKPVALIGAGGHACVVYDLLLKLGRRCIVIVERIPTNATENFPDTPVLSEESFITKYAPEEIDLALGMGFLPGSNRRRAIFNRLTHLGFTFPNLIHPHACVAHNVVLGQGVQVMAGSVVQANVICADNVIINTGASIDHHCDIGPHSHIAPGGVLCGNVKTGVGVFVGARAVITQGICIGCDTVVGAGALVLNNVDDNVTVKGVPARS